MIIFELRTRRREGESHRGRAFQKTEKECKGPEYTDVLKERNGGHCSRAGGVEGVKV